MADEKTFEWLNKGGYTKGYLREVKQGEYVPPPSSGGSGYGGFGCGPIVLIVFVGLLIFGLWGSIHGWNQKTGLEPVILNFPGVKTGGSPFTIYAIFFRASITDNELFENYDRLGLRAVTLEEFRAFYKKYPAEASRYREAMFMMAFDKALYESHSRIEMVRGSDGKVYIDYVRDARGGMLYPKWVAGLRFVCVKR